mgnify:CR=1 FL=1
MSLNFTNLVAQGRAKSNGVCWSEVELESLIALERNRGLSRVLAADYVRNGIVTLEDYDASQKVKFVPKTLDEAQKGAEEALVKVGQDAIKKKDKPKKI